MKKQTRICEQCGKEYTTSYFAKQSFCTQACRTQFRIEANRVPCTQCGNIFVKDSRPENKYCSLACQHESLKGKGVINPDCIFECQRCGKEYVSYYNAKDKFCTRECRKQALAESRATQCEQCGCVFVRNPRSQGRFCSHACYGESLKGRAPHNYNSIDFTCAQCNKSFVVQVGRLGRVKFCSVECRARYKIKRIAKVCKNCGKDFEVIPSQLNANFCSRKCMGEGVSGQQSHAWKSVEVPCAYCSQAIFRPPYRVKKSTNLFCGQECYSQWMSDFKHGEAHPCWKGGWHHYGENWTRQRHKVRERDGYKCQVCGVSEKKLGQQLDIHHITPFKTFNGDYVSANQLSNLICVCRTCHQKAEHGKVAFQPSLL